MIDDEIRRARKLLGTLVKISGLNRQEVDGRLGQGRGYSSQVLTGRVELKYRHILTFLEVVGVEPGMFFRVLYPDFPAAAEPREGAPGRLAERLFRQLHRAGYDERRAPLPPSPPALAGVDPEMLERRIREAIREVLGGAQSAEYPPHPPQYPPEDPPEPDR